jgi:6-pyruvoyltetrahydropterin/6-carboxytetrahydropterin synthase
MKLTIGVSETFDAAHYLPNHEKCGKVHGHTYRVEVEVEGELKNGMIMDFYELKNVLKETLKKYDHNLINELIENPTCENLCIEIFRELSKKLKVVRVRVWENPD